MKTQNVAANPNGEPKSRAGIEGATDEFIAAALCQLEELKRDLPMKANPQAVDSFLEQAVTALIQQRIGSKRMVSGLVRGSGLVDPEAMWPILSGVVHDPGKGAASLRAGSLVLVESAHCCGQIVVKASAPNMQRLENRLWETRRDYFWNLRERCIMGVVVRDHEARKKAWIRRRGFAFHAHNANIPKWCPIYVLFSYSWGGYKPYRKVIKALLENIHANIERQY